MIQQKITTSNKKMNPPSKIRSFFSKNLAGLQRIGKALMFPIAVLPIAALLNRLGALIQDPYIGSDLIGQGLEAIVIIGKVVQLPGSVVFDNLALIFAIGIGFGLSKDFRGEAALVAGITWFGMTALLGQGVLPEAIYGNVLTSEDLGGNSQLLYFLKGDEPIYSLDTGVIGGILAGGTVAFLYNRYKDIKLPQALSFFGGRRFIPMLGVLFTIPLALMFAIIWPWCQFALINIAEGLSNAEGAVRGLSSGAYGVLNRLLQPFGLHHIINTFVWFQLPITGEVIGTGETITVNGDINAFQEGIIGSGLFTTGFFPLFLGGLPGAALAMVSTADKEKRKQMLFFFGGTGFVAFLTGIDEPLIFAFIFVSPVLYVLNAILTGIFYMGVTWQGIGIGFGFSAGLIDYAISFWQSWQIADSLEGTAKVLANPLWIFAYAAVMMPVYYFIFTIVIKLMKVPTPGRELQLGLEDVNYSIPKKKKGVANNKDRYMIMAEDILKIVGNNNIVLVSNCATRLRLEVKDNSPEKINETNLKRAGGKGIVRLGENGFQIIIGTDVEHVANNLLEIWKKEGIDESKIDNTLSFEKNNNESEKLNSSETKEDIKLKIFAPTNGEVHKLSALNDGVFSKKMLGEGLVMKSYDGKVYAPVDGKLITVFDTKHAYGVETSQGVSILIHIGLDTVNLKGKGFTSYVKQGQNVKKGELICTFDKKIIKDAGYKDDVIIVITPESKAKPNAFTKATNAQTSQPIMMIK